MMPASFCIAVEQSHEPEPYQPGQSHGAGRAQAYPNDGLLTYGDVKD